MGYYELQPRGTKTRGAPSFKKKSIDMGANIRNEGLPNYISPGVFLKPKSGLLGVHYYILDFHTVISQLKRAGVKMYYYKLEYVHYVAIVISEVNFLTFLPVCSSRTRENIICHLSVCLSPTHIRFITYLTLKKLVS